MTDASTPALGTLSGRPFRNQLASVLMNLGQLVKARTHLHSALKIMTQLQANDLAYANSMHNLAEIELSLGHADRALPYARRALLYRLAAGLLEAGDEAQAMELFARAEAFAEQDDQREQSNALRLRYAEALDRQGQRTETHEILQRVETVLEQHPYPPSVVEGARALRERVGPS